MTGTGNHWHAFFSRWPADVSRRGIIIMAWDEMISFSGFSVGEHFICVERQTPDAMGGRTIVAQYEQVTGLKFTDVLKPKAIQGMGFELKSVEKT